MNLTHDQIQAMASGEPVPLVIEQTECVLIRKDRFEQGQALGDDCWTDDELRTIAGQTILDADSEGPIE